MTNTTESKPVIEIKHRYTGAVLFRSETAATLREAILQGIFARAYLAGAYLAGADLAGADLAGANLAGADLADAYLAGADLADAYLAGADLAGADLVPQIGEAPTEPRASYKRPETDAELAQLRAERAARYRERNPDVPVVENLDSKILAAVETPGQSLDMSTWHSCKTTHCIAGWAIHLAGKAGYGLEKKMCDPALAGRAIFLASKGEVPHFFATNDRALRDLKRRAAEEQST